MSKTTESNIKNTKRSVSKVLDKLNSRQLVTRHTRRNK